MKRSQILLTKKEGQLILILGLGVIFLLQNILLSRTFLKQTRRPSNIKVLKQEIKICICLADDRYTDRDMQLNNVTSLQELHQYVRDLSGKSSELGYWQKTALMNSAYALKSGYDIILKWLSSYWQYLHNQYERGQPHQGLNTL